MSKKPATFLIIISMIILSILLILAADFLLRGQLRKDQEISVTQELGTIRAQMEGFLNNNFFLMNGMAALISSRSTISTADFRSIARNLLAQDSALRNIAAAPDFIIRFVYPLEGNEAIMNLDYRKLPEQWPQALAARESREMVLAGPLQLVQGGKGLVARIPVYLEENGEFWGLVSSVLNFDTILVEAGIYPEHADLLLALGHSENPAEVFWGDATLFEEPENALILPVSLPSGSWLIAARPRGGWGKQSPYRWPIRIGILLFTLAATYSLLLLRRNRQILIESSDQFKAMSRASHDALFMIDSHDNVTFWNPSALAMFGYTEAEIKTKKLHELITVPRDRKLAHQGMHHFARSGEGPVVNKIMEMEAIRKNGEHFPVERSVAAFLLRGKWFAVGSVRDISARKKAEKKLLELATTDALTGLFNRRQFLFLSERELQKALRYISPFSLMMFDIDHFKHINDTYGHEAGDKILQSVAATFENELRKIDISGRIGGEEFAVALPETDLAGAAKVAERVRLALMNNKVRTGGNSIGLTVSIGVTQLNREQTTLDVMLKKADQLLYKAKRGGRNRVEVDPDPDGSHGNKQMSAAE